MSAGFAAVLVLASCRAGRDPSGAEETEPASSTGEIGLQPGSASSKEKVMNDEYVITDAQKEWLMDLARKSSAAAARGESFDPPRPDPSWTVLSEKGAAFVTLRRRADGSLRGCIGHIVARIPLFECVAEMARAATISDSRFRPVTPSELEGIHYEISVLTPLEDVAEPEEIEVGRHGVVLSMGYHHGVFLPQVPVEQGWDRTEYLDNLCYKAGLMRKGCWREKDARLEKFEAIVWEQQD